MWLDLLIYTKVNTTYEVEFTNSTDSSILSFIIDDDRLYYTVVSASFNILTFYSCPTGCASCYFPNNCSQCEQGYVLKGTYCFPTPTVCVRNIALKINVCQEYCSEECKTCNQTKHDCYQCADFYARDESGKCSIQSQSLSIFKDMRPFLNVLRKRGFKWIFMMVDDLWLYQYHQPEYEGIIRDVFRTISFIEEKQWEIVGLAEELEELKEEVSILPRYNPYSNNKFMAESRNTNLLLDNLFDFLLCSVPLILAMEFLFYRIFHCLFNY